MLGVIGGIGALAAGYAFLVEPRWVEWTEETVVIPGLAPELEGATVIQLSDTHVPRSISASFLERIVEECNDLHPDLVLLTGDLIESGPATIPTLASLFGRLRARLGVFGILGAHDKWRDPKLMARSLSESGVRILSNEAVPVGPPEAPLWIAGLDDNSGYGAPDLKKALAPVPDGAPVLLMMHSPDGIMRAVDRRVALVLAGHTHGGQVCLPFYGPLRTMSRYGRRFASGRYQVEDTVLYTNRGLGSHFSLRFLARPEVLRVRLTRGEVPCCQGASEENGASAGTHAENRASSTAAKEGGRP